MNQGNTPVTQADGTGGAFRGVLAGHIDLTAQSPSLYFPSLSRTSRLHCEAFLLTLMALGKWGKRLEAIEDLHLYASMILAVVLFVTCLIYALNDLGVLQQQL